MKLKLYNIKNYLRNLWVLRKTLANHTSYDYHGIFYYLNDFSKDHLKYGYPHLLYGYRYIAHMKLLKELSQRLLDDDYGTDKFEFDIDENAKDFKIIVKPKFDLPVSPVAYHKNKIQEHHLEMLTTLMRKHLFRWWD